MGIQSASGTQSGSFLKAFDVLMSDGSHSCSFQMPGELTGPATAQCIISFFVSGNVGLMREYIPAIHGAIAWRRRTLPYA